MGRVFIDEKGRFCYEGKNLIYREELINGRLRTAALDSRGTPVFEDSDVFLENSCFSLNVNGTDLVFDYEFENQTAEKSFYVNEESGGLHAVLALSARSFGVTVKIHTLLLGGDVLCRYLEIENKNDTPVVLGKITLFGGALFSSDNQAEIGYFGLSNWGEEGDYRTETLPVGSFAIKREHYLERYRQPFCICKSGEITFVCEMAYSGGFEMKFDTRLRKDGGNFYDTEFSASLSGHAPLRVLGAKEAFITPEVAFGVVCGTPDDAIFEMHKFIRAHYAEFPKTYAVEGSVGPGGCEEDDVISHMEASAKAGAELFYIDAGWYIKKGRGTADWPGPCGDWMRTPDRYESTLHDFREKAHALGMKFGLWVDVEKLGFESDAYINKKAPRLVGYNGEDLQDGPAAAMLDIIDPKGLEWAYGQIKFVIDTYKLDYFRLDSGTFPPDAFTCVSGYRENAALRYYEIWYDLFKKLRKEYPNVIFQNCSGGGMRCDMAMTGMMSNTWISDTNSAPESFSIVNGMSMMLPAEYLVKIIHDMGAEKGGSLDFIFGAARFGSPLIPRTLLKENGNFSQADKQKTVKMLESYKKFIRPIFENCRVYHHTPVVDPAKTGERGVLELAALDKKTALLGVFTLGEVEMDKTVSKVKFKGLDKDLKYSLYCNDVFLGEKKGSELMSEFDCEIKDRLDAKCFIAKSL